MGAVSVIGGAVGLASVGLGASQFTTGYFLSMLALSTGIGTGGSILSYVAEAGIRSDMTITRQGLLNAGFKGASNALITFGFSVFGGSAGAFDSMVLRSPGQKAHILNRLTKYHAKKALLAKKIPLKSRIFFTKFAGYLGDPIMKVLFVSFPTSVTRKIVNKFLLE